MQTNQYEVPNPEQEANARLMTAAPELLTALERVVAWIDAGCDPSAKSIDSARTIIAKATGKVVV